MSEKDREIDFLQKVTLAKRLLGVGRLVGLRHETLNLLAPGQEVSWEDVRRRRWPGGDPVGVTLEVPVWVPARAQRLKTYSGFEKKWQTVALTTPRPSGCVWFVRTLAEINDKTHYRPEMIQVEVNSKFAPLAALLLEYIFREGWYDPSKRLPLLAVRMGEDTYAVSAASGSGIGGMPELSRPRRGLHGGHRGPMLLCQPGGNLPRPPRPGLQPPPGPGHGHQ